MEKLLALIPAFPAVIASLPATFDTHDFILLLAHSNQRAYVEALNASSGDQPFMELHGQIGKALKRDYGHLVKEVEIREKSADIFGNPSSCSVWQRV